MSIDLSALLNSPLLQPWKDPQSGVVSYLLANNAAPLQQSFYYVNPSFSRDGRYLWIYCAFPPGGLANSGRTLAVADFADGEIRHFPETDFLDASPMVDFDTGEAYWCTGPEIWKRGPGRNDPCHFVNALPNDLVKNRRPWRIATHLTISADRRCLNLDSTLGRETHIGAAPLNGDPVEIWETMHAGFNHGQFSPVDSDLQLIAQDSYVDPVTGEIPPVNNRMWLIRRGEKARPIYANTAGGEKVVALDVHRGLPSREVDDGPGMHGHEWWGGDGSKVWFIHYGHGVKFVEWQTGHEELVWSFDGVSHAHSNTAGSLIVADALPPDRPDYSKVAFLNRATGRTVEILSYVPRLAARINRYHIHPHPQFCLDDQMICYTTTVNGRVSVALTPVETLIEATA
ncbi:hypothetical protein [Cerasicoccus arenae]|uniref:Oligogalacturonide lyase n=1 Tax=Cerasicoccus arenae TaxID=424488 RepID=A0A8J3DH80_9BACT|nr:hypothetical protein [Cerasicoccus arenae]MBK1859261.1 hypothetical protein [Cerasicoccus arenae]GHC01649.1 hypothetical protein GCM10007047_17760 [Cerasicoccus arenae]